MENAKVAVHIQDLRMMGNNAKLHYVKILKRFKKMGNVKIVKSIQDQVKMGKNANLKNAQINRYC